MKEQQTSNTHEPANGVYGVLPAVDFKQPLCLSVKYDLSADFVTKVNSEKGCSIKNVIEISSCNILEYWIDCPKEKENLITDFAFMTWIRNPCFQKYYSDSKAFEKISDKYISEREQEEKKNSDLTAELINENKMLRKSLILGLYHDGWADRDGNPRPIHNNLGAPDWVRTGFEALSNSR